MKRIPMRSTFTEPFGMPYMLTAASPQEFMNHPLSITSTKSGQSVISSESGSLLLSVLCLLQGVTSCLGLKSRSRKTKVLTLNSIPRGGGVDGPIPDRPGATSTGRKSKQPLWSGGVYKDDIDDLVNACLKDPDINIKAIPDWLEKQIYKSTITLVLNALHRCLNGIHGKTLWNHEFQLMRLPRRKANMEGALAILGQHTTSPEHNKVLEQVADRLLANKHINQPLIPDVLERQLYANCLKIVFRVLDLLAVSFRLTLCGHDLKLKLDPSDDWTKASYQEAVLKRMADKTSKPSATCLNDLSMEQMKELAREVGAQDQDQRPFWQRYFSPANNEMVAQLHASVYCLILGVVDDIMENTEIQLLSDRIEFDLTPVEIQAAVDEDDSEITELVVGATTQASSIQHEAPPKTNGLTLVAVGMAVGYALHGIVVDNDFRLGSILLDLKTTASQVSGSVQNVPEGVSNAAKSLAGGIMAVIFRGRGKDNDVLTEEIREAKTVFGKFRLSSGKKDAGKIEEENGGDESIIGQLQKD